MPLEHTQQLWEMLQHAQEEACEIAPAEGSAACGKAASVEIVPLEEPAAHEGVKSVRKQTKK